MILRPPAQMIFPLSPTRFFEYSSWPLLPRQRRGAWLNPTNTAAPSCPVVISLYAVARGGGSVCLAEYVPDPRGQTCLIPEALHRVAIDQPDSAQLTPQCGSVSVEQTRISLTGLSIPFARSRSNRFDPQTVASF